MTNRRDRDPKDHLYHIKGKTYKKLRGSREMVMNGTAYMTTGGLTTNDLIKNKHGYNVSKKKHFLEKRLKRLKKAGYYTKKGEFGAYKNGVNIYKNKTKKATRKNRTARNR
jgi:hypothetical protein